jgi:hypothetical protein
MQGAGTGHAVSLARTCAVTKSGITGWPPSVKSLDDMGIYVVQHSCMVDAACMQRGRADTNRHYTTRRWRDPVTPLRDVRPCALLTPSMQLACLAPCRVCGV